MVSEPKFSISSYPMRCKGFAVRYKNQNVKFITLAIETSTTTIHFVLKVNIRAGTTVEEIFFSLLQHI